MPNLNGKGPAGKGEKTGGQMGNCSGAKPKQRPFDGRGMGMGKGRGNKKGRRGVFGRRSNTP